MNKINKKNSILKLTKFIKNKKKFHIHIIGIGGAGVSGIAKILFNQGYKISGSELFSNIITDNLSLIGIKIYLNHNSRNIKDANMIIKSSAIPNSNIEVIEAYKKKIPIFNRAEILSELMNNYKGIAISGTHGKTTTTAMIVSIYIESGLDPTFVNGGLIKSLGTNSYLGNSNYFIAEADESDSSFLLLKPKLSVITNIEADHMDYYKGSFKNLKKTFLKFLHNLPLYGKAIVCIDDDTIRKIIPKIKCNVITYGFSMDADIRIYDYKQLEKRGYFKISYNNNFLMDINLNIPGYHNALNAAAAIAIAKEEKKIKKKNIFNALNKFQGTNRRFEILGEFYLKKSNNIHKIIIIDDYGHHPTEIEVTIKTLRISWPKKKLIMIFQPHRYTRTRYLYNQFVKVLSKVDILLILNIYSAGETYIKNFNSQSLCKSIFKYKKINPIFIKNNNLIFNKLISILEGDDIFLFQGAGNIGDIARSIIRNNLK